MIANGFLLLYLKSARNYIHYIISDIFARVCSDADLIWILFNHNKGKISIFSNFNDFLIVFYAPFYFACASLSIIVHVWN